MAVRGGYHRLSAYSNRGRVRERGEGEDTALVIDALARVASGGHAGAGVISEVIAGMFGAETGGTYARGICGCGCGSGTSIVTGEETASRSRFVTMVTYATIRGS